MNTKIETHDKDIVTKFIDSWISIFVFIFLLLIINIVQIVIFIFGGTISGFQIGESGSWVAWVYLVISFPFSVCSVLSIIFSIRKHHNFLIFALILEAGYTISSFAAGMMFSTTTVVFFFMMNIYRYMKIKAEGPGYSINTKLIKQITFWMVIILVILAVLSIELDKNEVFWWNSNVYEGRNIVKYLDVVAGTITLVGGAMSLTKNKYGFTLFVICDLVYLVLFVNAHQWSNVVITIVFIALEILGYIVWHNHDERSKE